ncbi:pyrroline-5-carboxylate reductase family protein [Halomonas sp. NCCP-2165]|nr:pyrroline-5-carboxylate reductase [Halomonas sp. NCCP-2165]GKW48716.1 pyrroline-5-carboxylate reductase [Halomonas sp. NCCP-2165]
MHNDVVLGIIGGQGWMGRSLGRAWLAQGLVPAERLVVSSRSLGDAYHDWPGVRCVTDNQELVALADVILLAVRPQDLAAIEVEARGKLVISLLAMTSLEAVAHRLGSQRVVRAMPNAAAEIGRGYFPWVAGEGVDDADKRLVQALLMSGGKARELPEESDLDYLTALSGAGPAYPALLARALLEDARRQGLPEAIAFEAVMETLVGGSLLLEHLGDDPGAMVRRLIDYQGTTARGLETMIDGGFEAVVTEGLAAAHRAARGL